ncbi:hypothetical protein RJ639_031221 [Escallonia herrerae]|uniref:Uncharacterized protein n=1 Tax=Escallonia herrerae TaxID=1293975 RepID=A0AA89BNE2_9ASTE|nr:hypothetical protein RJ639_031221 [Escallonia herrerae]
MVNAKALWESLERKYKTEDAGSKKFVVGKFLDFKMVDSKTVISQVQEFQLILHDIHAEGMVLGESFQVAALIEKLPPTWKDFKNYLKHKRKEMKLEDLIVRLRIEEDNRQSEKKAGNYHQEAKANVVEQAKYDVKISNFKEQAEYVKALQEDNADNYAKAFPLYMNALEYLKTHPKCKKLRTLRPYSEMDLISMLGGGNQGVLDDEGSRPAAKVDATVA